MSSTDSSAETHAYFQAIETCFIRLRGAPLLLSPADWQIAQEWHRQGIPLELVLETLEEVFASRRARGSKGRVQGLRYCASAVEKAWDEQRELRGTASRRKMPELDRAGRLEELSSGAGDFALVPPEIAERIAGLEGRAEEIEARLAELDREMLESAAQGLAPSVLEEIRESAAQSVSGLRSRLDAAQVTETEERLVREGIRRRLDLPVLSLFGSLHESTND